MELNIIRLPEVIRMTGLGRSTIYHMVSKNLFPKQHLLGARAVGWLEKDIKKWIEGKVVQNEK